MPRQRSTPTTGPVNQPEDVRTEPRTVDEPGDWRAALLQGLPRHALSLVQIGTTTHEGDWSPVAHAVVSAALAAERPVIYVQCGGLGDYYDVDDILHNIEDPRFMLFRDRDLVVRRPSLGLNAASQPHASVVEGRPVYCCVLPSWSRLPSRSLSTSARTARRSSR